MRTPNQPDPNDNPNPEDDMTPPTPPAPDPFDPAAYRLSGQFNGAMSVKKLLTTVPVRKPDKTWFVRTHPSEAFRLQTAVIELKEDRETYLVPQHLWPELVGESALKPMLLVTAVNRQGVVFLWPCRMPGEDGRLDSWSESAVEAVKLASEGWVRVKSNMSLGAYEPFLACGELSEPEWPDTDLGGLLKVAFRDKLINSADHPVLRKLRGEV